MLLLLLFALSYCIAFKIYHCYLVRFQRHNSVINVQSPVVLTKSSHAFPQSLGEFIPLPNAMFLSFPLCLAFKLWEINSSFSPQCSLFSNFGNWRSINISSLSLSVSRDVHAINLMIKTWHLFVSRTQGWQLFSLLLWQYYSSKFCFLCLLWIIILTVH